MAFTLDDLGNYTDDPEVNVTQIYASAPAYAHQIRLFTVLVSGQLPIKSAAPYKWGIPSQATLGGDKASPATGNVPPIRPFFSAECWATGVSMAAEAPSTPLGLISASRGGAAIQSFMDMDAVRACPHARPIWNPPHFGGIGAWWGGMIAPLLPLRVSAFVWHQGEENSGEAFDYICFQREMISLWQKTAAAYGGNQHTPFVFVQLQPCGMVRVFRQGFTLEDAIGPHACSLEVSMHVSNGIHLECSLLLPGRHCNFLCPNTEGIPPEMRYAQAQALTANSGLPNVGMAACFDLGDSDPAATFGECHSRYKMECGRRLALEVSSLLRGVSSSTNLGSSRTNLDTHAGTGSSPNSNPDTNIVGGSTPPLVGPTITSFAVNPKEQTVTLTLNNAKGLEWVGTKQCTRCCGIKPNPPGTVKPYPPVKPYGGKGLTNSYPMHFFNTNGQRQYITAGSVILTNATITIPLASSAVWPATTVYYGWEDFAECVLHNSDGLPLPPFNLSLATAPNTQQNQPNAVEPTDASAAALHPHHVLPCSPTGMIVADGAKNWSIVPTGNCSAPIKWCTQGPKEVTEALLRTDIFNFCTVEKAVKFTEGNCADLSKFTHFIGYDPLFRHASLWL
jgi:hypothetical protein